MNWIDIILLLPILYGIIRGLSRGAIKEIASLIGAVVAYFVAKAYASSITDCFQSMFDMPEKVAPVVAFVTLFFAVIICIFFLAKLFSRFLSAISLGWLNRLGGAVFCTLKYVLILSVIVNLFAAINSKCTLVEQETIENSKLFKPIKSVIENAIPYISDKVKNNEATGD